MIVDRYGREIPVRKVRMTLGFIPQVEADSMFEVNVTDPPRRDPILLGDAIDEPVIAQRYTRKNGGK